MDDASRKAQELEKNLREERLKELFMFKVLLLGAGESGKSTVVKQIKLCHNKMPSDKENETIADSLHQNVIDCMKTLLYACSTFGYDLNEEDTKTAKEVQEFDEGKRIDCDFGERIEALWQSDSIRKTYKRNDEYWLLDSCSYYFKNLMRFTNFGYKPTGEDSVMARIRTTGIVVSPIEDAYERKDDKEPEKIKYQIVDVGGQKNERKKWMHCFDDVKCILFLCSLAEYNQVLFEDAKQNRMDDSVKLLNDMSKKQIFENTPFFVFMNKKDVFERMLREHPLSNKFPEYDGGQNTQAAIKFIESVYKAVLPPTKKDIKFFPITAVVKSDVAAAFKEVKTALLAKNRPLIDEEKKKIANEAREQERKNAGCVIL